MEKSIKAMSDFRNADRLTDLTLCSLASFIWGLLQDTYKTSGVIGRERLKLVELLETRAWLCHIFSTVVRIIYPLLGIAFWQKGLKNAAEFECVNSEFVLENRKYLLAMIYTYTAVCIAIDILAWKWRWLGRYIFYLECYGMVLNSLVPIRLGDLGEVQIIAILVQLFVVYGCDVGFNVLGAFITACFNSFAVYPFIYCQTMDSALATHKTTNICSVALMSMIVVLFFTYIARIRAQMEELIEENLGLLTHLSEGLLLVDKENSKFNICTEPAFNIFSCCEPNQTSSEEAYIQQLPKIAMNQEMFKQVEAKMDDGTVRMNTQTEKSPERLKSLQELLEIERRTPNGEQCKNIFEFTRGSKKTPSNEAATADTEPLTEPKLSYSIIRVKHTTYLQRPCFAISFQDVTHYMEALRLESQVLEERNRTRSLETFTSTISHEFRTPLGTSLMFLENLLESEMLTEDQRSIISLIVCQLNLLLCLVNDVLDIKLIESGQFVPKLETFSPKTVLDFIVQIFKPQSEMQGITIEHECITALDFDQSPVHGHDTYLIQASPLPAKLRGDQIRLKQILINLVKNALKFTSRGTIRLIAAYDAEQEMLRIHVVDTGKGIKDEDVTRLFMMFGKLQRTAEMNSEGIGMGLMICKNLVERNEGKIKVHSDGVDKGSTFTFAMKMSLPQEVQDTQTSAQLDLVNEAATTDILLHQDREVSSSMLTQSISSPQPQSVQQKNAQDDNTLAVQLAHAPSICSISRNDDESVQHDGSEEQLTIREQQHFAEVTFRGPQDSDCKQLLNSQPVCQPAASSEHYISISNSNSQESLGLPSFRTSLQNLEKQAEGGAIDPSSQLLVIQLRPQAQFAPNAQGASLDQYTNIDFSEGNGLISESYRIRSDATTDLNEVLIVDDCAFNIIATRSLLQQLNLGTDALQHSKDIVALLSDRIARGQPMYKLILMDYSMPDVDGTQCTKLVRKFAAEHSLSQPFICCMTAYTETQFKDSALRAGMNSYLVKPVFKQQMQTILQEASLM